jgi:hypothetical protein
MTQEKVIGSSLLILSVLTAAGLFFKNDFYWLIYNCVVIFTSFLGAMVLLRKK